MVLIRVPARTTGGAGGTSQSLLYNTSNDTISTGEGNAWSNVNPAAAESVRQTSVPLAGTYSLFQVRLQSNANTVDGAVFRLRVNTANGSELVTVDQATGIFQDIGNSDAIVQGDIVGWRYTQGNNTVNMFDISIVFVP